MFDNIFDFSNISNMFAQLFIFKNAGRKVRRRQPKGVF
jgi:hypothetical protein